MQRLSFLTCWPGLIFVTLRWRKPAGFIFKSRVRFSLKQNEKNSTTLIYEEMIYA